MQMIIDIPEIKDAIECYLESIGMETAQVEDIKVVAGRNGGESRIEIDLKVSPIECECDNGFIVPIMTMKAEVAGNNPVSVPEEQDDTAVDEEIVEPTQEEPEIKVTEPDEVPFETEEETVDNSETPVEKETPKEVPPLNGGVKPLKSSFFKK